MLNVLLKALRCSWAVSLKLGVEATAEGEAEKREGMAYMWMSAGLVVAAKGWGSKIEWRRRPECCHWRRRRGRGGGVALPPVWEGGGGEGGREGRIKGRVLPLERS